MKIAIYCRTSKAEQNLANQKLELEQYAKGMGYDYEVFEEQESSRKTRPIKDRLFQEAIQKKWDMILVWKLDRWARSMQELVNDLDIMRKNRVMFKTLKDNITLDDNPSNILQINILAAFCQFERDIIRQRTIAGLERARAEGKKLGRPKQAITKQGRVYVLQNERNKTDVLQ